VFGINLPDCTPRLDAYCSGSIAHQRGKSMKDKLATVVLRFDNKLDYGFVSGIINLADKKEIYEIDDKLTIVILPVKKYSMEDHQFIQLGVHVHKGVQYVWISREFVKTIIEGEIDTSAAFSFLGKATK
jgi:hypothetical protein